LLWSNCKSSCTFRGCQAEKYIFFNYISLLTKGKWFGIFYRSLCSTYKLLWTKRNLLCTIYKSLCWQNMSLWANDKPLSIHVAYRSLCSNYRLLWTKASCCVQLTSRCAWKYVVMSKRQAVENSLFFVYIRHIFQA